MNIYIKSDKKINKSIYYNYTYYNHQKNFSATIVINKKFNIYRVLYSSFYGIKIAKDEK